MYNKYKGGAFMAQAIILERDNHIKVAYVGFSLSIWVAGFFVPLYRKEWKSAFQLCILAVITLGISNIYYAFTYNNTMLRQYLTEGYTIRLDPYSEALLQYYNIPYK